MNKTRSEKVIIIGHFTFHKPPSDTERQLEAGRAQVVGATRTGREAGRETDHMRAHTLLTGKCWYCGVIKLDTKLTNLDTTWVLTSVHLLSSLLWLGDEGCSWSWRRDMCRHSQPTRSANHIRIPQGHSGHWTLHLSLTLHRTHTHTNACVVKAQLCYEGGTWCLKCRVLRLLTRKMIPLYQLYLLGRSPF